MSLSDARNIELQIEYTQTAKRLLAGGMATPIREYKLTMFGDQEIILVVDETIVMNLLEENEKLLKKALMECISALYEELHGEE